MNKCTMVFYHKDMAIDGSSNIAVMLAPGKGHSREIMFADQE